jgi:hypothetical protein
VAIYTGAKALSRWPINDESTLTLPWVLQRGLKYPWCFSSNIKDFQIFESRVTLFAPFDVAPEL